MAQGLLKKPSKLSSGKKSATGPRKGMGIIKPKKAKAVRQQKMLKKHTSHHSALTEKRLAERAGHLELLKGGKKDKDKDKDKEGKKGK